MTTPTPVYTPMAKYAITLNLSNALQGFTANSRMYTAYQHYVDYVKKHLSELTYFRFYTEISSKGRIHMHGVIQYPNNECIYQYLLLHAHALHMDKRINIDIRPIKQDEKWEEYITKDKPIMERYMKQLKVPYPLTNDNIDDFTIDTQLSQHWPPEVFCMTDSEDEE